ncbi:MAG: glucose-6-phosphate isomerase [Bacteroidales bacterium]
MKEEITIGLRGLEGFVSYEEVAALAKHSLLHLESLKAGTGPGNDFLGWIKLPEEIEPQLPKIIKTAEHLRSISDTTVVIGIGGSYLGARAVIEALSHSFPKASATKHHEIVYAGHNISEEYVAELLEYLDTKNYTIIVISKSGTTTEPAIAFRLLREHMEKKYGMEAAADRIIAITDAARGALRTLADLNGYDTFVIPDNIGGRYSVLTPVGLLPIAVAGFDIKEFVRGARTMALSTRDNKNTGENPSLIYAAARNLVLQTGRSVEIMVNFHPKLHFFAEWWKQLYGESEGKEKKGIYPASVDFTTDLHSMGQYIQEGQRIIFETFISVKPGDKKVTIPTAKEDSDQLNYLAGKRMSYVDKCAEEGTILAHNDGEVPVMTVNVPALDIFNLGQMVYFFELACAVSGYILDVNPFDQPGVEAYKKNMFALLNKPGFEEAGKKLRERLK